MTDSSSAQRMRLIDKALAAIPEFKYVLGAGAVMAIAGLTTQYGTDVLSRFTIALVLVIVAALVFLLALMARHLTLKTLRTIARTLAWFFTVFFMICATALAAPLVLSIPIDKLYPDKPSAPPPARPLSALQRTADVFLTEFDKCLGSNQYSRTAWFNTARVDLLFRASHLSREVEAMYYGCNGQSEDARAKAVQARAVLDSFVRGACE